MIKEIEVQTRDTLVYNPEVAAAIRTSLELVKQMHKKTILDTEVWYEEDEESQQFNGSILDESVGILKTKDIMPTLPPRLGMHKKYISISNFPSTPENRGI